MTRVHSSNRFEVLTALSLSRVADHGSGPSAVRVPFKTIPYAIRNTIIIAIPSHYVYKTCVL